MTRETSLSCMAGRENYAVRTSRVYDDRDADTIGKLEGIVKVCEGPAPQTAFFLVPNPDEGGDPRVPSINLEVMEYVNVGTLPKSVQDIVRTCLEKVP